MRNLYVGALASVLCNVDMEQTGTVAGTDAVTALVTPKKARKPAVPASVFVPALAEASKRDKKPTAAELAAELGMDKGSFDQRLNQLRMEWKDMQEAQEAPAFVDGNVKPFPFTLADGRSVGGNTGDGVSAGKAAILAALAAVG